MKSAERTIVAWTRSRCLRNAVRKKHREDVLGPLQRMVGHHANGAAVMRNDDGSTTLLTHGLDGGMRVAIGEEIVIERVPAGRYRPGVATMRLSMPTKGKPEPIPSDDAAARTAMAHHAIAAIARLEASTSARERMPIDDEDRMRIAVSTIGAAIGSRVADDVLRLPNPWGPPAFIAGFDPIDPLGLPGPADPLTLHGDVRRLAMTLLPRGWVVTYDGRPEDTPPPLRVIIKPLSLRIGEIDPAEAMRRIAAVTDTPMRERP